MGRASGPKNRIQIKIESAGSAILRLRVESLGLRQRLIWSGASALRTVFKPKYGALKARSYVCGYSPWGFGRGRYGAGLWP